MTTSAPPNVIIVGAGLAGAFMAVMLGRRGFSVAVYERRSDIRSGMSSAGPSMNLGLSRRGIHALTEIGLIDQVMAMTIPMHGRMIHALDNTLTFQPYGKNASQSIFAIKRNSLNITLINAAEAMPNVQFFFGMRCSRLAKEHGTIYFHDEQTGTEICVEADLMIGADGIFSTVRQQMQRGERADYHQDFLDWGWKELTIPAGQNATFQLEKNVFHLWSRGNCMIFAHPNPDGTFCCSCLFPFEGDPAFGTLQERDAVRTLFETTFGDIVPLAPTLVDDFLRSPIIPLMSIRTSQWHYKDRIVLIGDACHAVFPFYAQGMNAAFEDCLVLNECLDRHPDCWEGAFAEYQAIRKANTDALAEMSRENFIELRDKVGSPTRRARTHIDRLLGTLFPRAWMPLHAIVTHTTMPYAQALAQSKKQDAILKGASVGLVALLFLLFRDLLLYSLSRKRSNQH